MPDKPIQAPNPENQSDVNANLTPCPINPNEAGLNIKPKKKLKLRLVISAVICLIVIVVGAFTWYRLQILPVSSDLSQLKKITIKSGSTPDQIGELLQKESVIRNSLVFSLSARLSGRSGKLQAGTYRLSPAENTDQIINHLVNGSVDEFSITFLPGCTIKDVTKVLEKAGYSTSEVSTALNAKYDSPLFASKPTTADLEGYIYGETYNFNSGATVSEILARVFDQYYSDITKNNLISGIKAHGLNLYQGITLASIIQREVGESDQRQVAQVFYSRLNSNVELGSDVTYQYIADKLGMARDVNLDSPYNTRKYKGLPPGPISTPGLSALKAVANPAEGDYLYFLSGDDDVTYFARTYAEHEANIASHCKVKCSVQ